MDREAVEAMEKKVNNAYVREIEEQKKALEAKIVDRKVIIRALLQREAALADVVMEDPTKKQLKT